MVEDSRYSYDRFGSKGQRVGQAALDLMKDETANYTVEDILDQFGKDYLDEIRKRSEENKNTFRSPFYIFSLLHKDLGQFGLSNVMRHWAIPRQSEPLKDAMMDQYPHHTKTLFEVDAKKGEITLLWTIPGIEECISILKNPGQYDQDLIKWINEVNHPYLSMAP